MTLTETRPEAAPAPHDPAAESTSREPLFATADHKRLGRFQLLDGLLHLAIGAVLLAIARAGAGDIGIGAQLSDRAASAETTFLYVLGLPVAWLGLASVIVPLQIGATRLALPRMHAAATWMLLAGGLVVAAGYIAGSARAFDLNAPVPPPAGEAGGLAGTELVIAGLALAASALLLQAVSLIATILTERAPGMTVARMPLFAASILVTASVLVIALPVFIAGLAILGLDQHFHGEFFVGPTPGALSVWQHLLFLPGWPLLLLMGLPALGALCDIVAGHSRRALFLHAVAGGLLTAYGILTVLTWAAGRQRLFAITQPVSTIALAVLGVPVGLLLLLWLATLRFGRPAFHVSMLANVLAVVLPATAVAGAIAAAIVGVESDDAAAFARGNLTLLALGPSALALVGAAWHWSPKLTGRVASTAAGAAALLVVLVGVLLAALPGWIVGFDASDDTLVVAAAGGVVLALGFLLTAGGMGTGSDAGPDPYGAVTLEWATTSPPPPHNFDTLPEVRSVSPLGDVRDAGGAL